MGADLDGVVGRNGGEGECRAIDMCAGRQAVEVEPESPRFPMRYRVRVG